jgi:hypothetical protein
MVHYRERKENYGKTAGCIMSPPEQSCAALDSESIRILFFLVFRRNTSKPSHSTFLGRAALSRTTRHLTSSGNLLKEIVVDEPYFFQAAMLQVRKK